MEDPPSLSPHLRGTFRRSGPPRSAVLCKAVPTLAWQRAGPSPAGRPEEPRAHPGPQERAALWAGFSRFAGTRGRQYSDRCSRERGKEPPTSEGPPRPGLLLPFRGAVGLLQRKGRAPGSRWDIFRPVISGLSRRGYLGRPAFFSAPLAPCGSPQSLFSPPHSPAAPLWSGWSLPGSP